MKRDHGLLSVNITKTWYDDDPYILATMTKQIVYLDDPKAGRGWKVVQTMDHRNVYAIPEQDRTDDDIDNVANQRVESLMESGAETLQDTNLIQEPFQIEGVSSIEISIQSITIDLINIPRYDIAHAKDQEKLTFRDHVTVQNFSIVRNEKSRFNGYFKFTREYCTTNT